MSLLVYLQRAATAAALTLFYTILTLLHFAFSYLKNPFGNPWALKLKLEPPTCLTDKKYGVHKYIKVNNIKLHYVESGDPSKPLMIFVHGFPEFWYSWRHQIVEFQKDYWCIAVDMRGYGDSERPDGISSYKINLLVEDLRDLVKQLGREKCILVSHDWGGLIACRYRDVYPETISALVMLASASMEAFHEEIWNNPAQRKKSWYIFLFQAPWVPESLMQMNNCAMLDKMFDVSKSKISTQDIECYKYWFGKQHTMTPPINYYRANFQYTLPEKPYCEDEVPHYVVHGENDDYLSPDALLAKMSKDYASIEYGVLKDIGHFMQQEEPQKVNNVIRCFLAKHKL